MVSPVPSKSSTSRVRLEATATASIPATWSPGGEANQGCRQCQPSLTYPPCPRGAGGVTETPWGLHRPGEGLHFQQGSEVGSAQPLRWVGRPGLVSSSPPCSRAGESWFLWQPMPASPPPPPFSGRREGGSRGMLGFCRADIRPQGRSRGSNVMANAGRACGHAAQSSEAGFPTAKGAWQGGFTAGNQTGPVQGPHPAGEALLPTQSSAPGHPAKQTALLSEAWEGRSQSPAVSPARPPRSPSLPRGL